MEHRDVVSGACLHEPDGCFDADLIEVVDDAGLVVGCKGVSFVVQEELFFWILCTRSKNKNFHLTQPSVKRGEGARRREGGLEVRHCYNSSLYFLMLYVNGSGEFR